MKAEQVADTVKGACLCGAVQFEVTLPTLGCCHCHCIRTRGATVVRSRLLPAVVIPTAVAIGLLGVQAAFATADVCGVSSAKANDLMALSSANGIRDWIPPGVACSSDDPDYTSPLCQWRTTITQDRMIGDHRLIVASSAQPPQKAIDYVFVFACVDGRPTPTTH